MNINKISNTPQYETIFDVSLPIRFYFNYGGGFDGIEVMVEDATERDQELVEELLLILAKATGIKFKYKVERDEEKK